VSLVQTMLIEDDFECIGDVGFNPIHKLPAKEFLKQKLYNLENMKQIHRDFPLDLKTGTTRLIFHYVPFNVTIHIYTCRSIHKPQPVNPGLEHNCSSHNCSSLDWIYKILWEENHDAQKHVQNPFTKPWVGPPTIFGSAPILGSRYI